MREQEKLLQLLRERNAKAKQESLPTKHPSKASGATMKINVRTLRNKVF